MKALILDFGGVLTNNHWEVLRGFARREGLDESMLIGLFASDPEGFTEELRRRERKGDVILVDLRRLYHGE
ncbi:MAG TPA: hypothetical protein VFC19_43525 [Candidatus Limnocylindrales bacterium]|nr:hypothetical protein [Candidatus Limnocylindrales bacterium]